MAGNTASVDWTTIINNTIAQVPSWIAISRNQPVPVAIPPGTQGASLAVSSQGVAGSLSPGLLIAGVVVVIALVFVLKK